MILKNVRQSHFLSDDSARVPFAVIGIFLVIISTLVSLNLTRLDIKMAKIMSSNIEIFAAKLLILNYKQILKQIKEQHKAEKIRP